MTAEIAHLWALPHAKLVTESVPSESNPIGDKTLDHAGFETAGDYGEGPPGLVAESESEGSSASESESEGSSASDWPAENEFVGPEDPDWDKATPLTSVSLPTNANKLQFLPSRPSRPNEWIIDKMFGNGSDESVGSPSRAPKVRFDLAA